MSLSSPQLAALRHILQACHDECLQSPLGNLLENHLKVVALARLLACGYSVMEGANVAGQGRIISLAGSTIATRLVPRDHMAAAPGSSKAKNSPDIRVYCPCRLVVELQIRSVLGSQNALFSDNLVDDLDRVTRHTADAFVLAADSQLYDALRGLKADARGRKAKHTDRLLAALPSRDLLSCTIGQDPIGTDSGGFSCIGSASTGRFGIERVVVGLWAHNDAAGPPRGSQPG